MNFHTYKITEKQNNFYVYYVSLFDDPEYTLETFEHFVSNSPQIPMCQYLMTVDFDNVTCEKVAVSPVDVINKNLPHDPKCMNISNEFVAQIPPPKPKREPKKKAEKEPKPAPKPRGKKGKTVEISTDNAIVN